MYTSPAFSVTAPSVIRTFVDQNNFGLLVSFDGEQLHDTLTPLLITPDLTRITGHIARANQQWRAWTNHPSVKVIFHGPHAYVSPRFYRSEFNVPTWNYPAVSVDGKIEIVEDRAASLGIIQNLIAKHEGAEGWKLDLADERYLKLLDAVVCFSIATERIDAKFKLNQNKSEEDQRSVIAHLAESSNFTDRQTAELMSAMRAGQ